MQGHGRPGRGRSRPTDYRGKIAILGEEFLATYGRPMLIGDLMGEAVDRLLPERRYRGQALTVGSRNAYRRIVGSFATWLVDSERSQRAHAHSASRNARRGRCRSTLRTQNWQQYSRCLLPGTKSATAARSRP